MTIDRLADLHYAFQFGEAFAVSRDPAVAKEFHAKFGHDREAIAEYERAVAGRHCAEDLEG